MGSAERLLWSLFEQLVDALLDHTDGNADVMYARIDQRAADRARKIADEAERAKFGA